MFHKILIAFAPLGIVEKMENDEGSSGGYDYETLWQKDFKDGSGNMGVAVDSDDNAIVCGISQNEDKGIVVKYDRNGKEQWSDADLLEICNFSSMDKSTTNPVVPPIIKKILGREYGYFFDVAVDSENNIIVAGTFTREGGTESVVYIKKYSPDGTTIWEKTHSPFKVNIASGITIDSDDNIFVAGGGGSIASLSFAGFVIKISGLNGRIMWRAIRRKRMVALYTSVTIDSFDDVLASGFASRGDDIDMMVTKFGGKRGWRRRELVRTGNKAPTKITADNQGNFVVAGKAGADVEMQYLMKFDSGFIILWENENETKGFLYGAATVKNGNIAVTGYRDGIDEYYAAIHDGDTGDRLTGMLLGKRISNLMDDYMRGISADSKDDLLVTGARTIGKTMKICITAAEVPPPEQPAQPSVPHHEGGGKESLLQKILRWIFGR